MFFLLLVYSVSLGLIAVWLNPYAFSGIEIMHIVHPVINVVDPANQLVGGFRPTGTNQPFASNFATALSQHPTYHGNLTGAMFTDSQKLWFLDFLQQQCPIMYGKVTMNGAGLVNAAGDTPIQAAFWNLGNGSQLQTALRALP